MSYIVMCGPNGYCLSVVLVINKVWFLHSCVELGIFLRIIFFLLSPAKALNYVKANCTRRNGYK